MYIASCSFLHERYDVVLVSFRIMKNRGRFQFEKHVPLSSAVGSAVVDRILGVDAEVN